MKWRLIHFSAVVAGQAHNPTILNPDFLKKHRIVPDNWKQVETITTPPLSMVRYANGVSISVDQNKLQVTDPNVEDGPAQSLTTDIATAYVKLLPHVPYIAVGNNFNGLLPTKNPSQALQRLFLRSGSWDNSPSKLDSAGVKLGYKLQDGATFTVTLDAGDAQLPDKSDKQPVIIAVANFNRVCAQPTNADGVVAQLKMALSDWATFDDFTKHQLKELSNS